MTARLLHRSVAAARCRRHPKRPARGAALLTALVIVALVSTMAAAMVWQQWRAVQVESAERARVQAWWVLNGALDWARLILREDAKSGGADHLGEPWATPLAEARLSTFLAADRDNTDDAPEAFLSGSIVDLQSRYNVRNLVDGEGRVPASERKTLQRLFELAGVSPALADTLAANMQQAVLGTLGAGLPPGAKAGSDAPAEPGGLAAPALSDDPPILPTRVEDLQWLGLDAYTLDKLRPFLVMLPQPTPINLNTAPKEVLAAVIDGLDLASAERLVQSRQNSPLKDPQEAVTRLNLKQPIDGNRAGVTSAYFEVRGRLRMEDRVIEQRYLVERRLLEIVTLQQERMAGVEPSAAPGAAR